MCRSEVLVMLVAGVAVSLVVDSVMSCLRTLRVRELVEAGTFAGLGEEFARRRALPVEVQRGEPRWFAPRGDGWTASMRWSSASAALPGVRTAPRRRAGSAAAPSGGQPAALMTSTG